MTTHRAKVDAAAAPRRGFAMLAVIVAIVLIATGVMAIGAANTARMRSQTQSTARSAALSVARTYLEDVRSRDPWSIVAEPMVHVNAQGQIDPAGSFTRELIVVVERTNLLRLEVVVTGPGTMAPVRLMTNAYRGTIMTPVS